jgi:hypothetical protein
MAMMCITSEVHERYTYETHTMRYTSMIHV